MLRESHSSPHLFLAIRLKSGEVRYLDPAAWNAGDVELESRNAMTGRDGGLILRSQVAELVGPVSIQWSSSRQVA